MAGASSAAITEKVWGEYVSVVCQILAKQNTKMSETWVKEFKDVSAQKFPRTDFF